MRIRGILSYKSCSAKKEEKKICFKVAHRCLVFVCMRFNEIFELLDARSCDAERKEKLLKRVKDGKKCATFFFHKK